MDDQPDTPPIDKLAAALVVALGELTDVPKTRTARVQMKSGGEYRYTYADLGDALEMVRPILAKHGLGVVQPVSTGAKGVEVTTVIVHSSGQTMTFGPLAMSAGDTTPQAMGSAITYARRYSLLAALGLATEEDDDGQAAAAKRPSQPKQQANTRPAAQRPADPVPAAGKASETTRKRLFAVLAKAGVTEDDRHAFAAQHLGGEVVSFSDLTEADAAKLIGVAQAMADTASFPDDDERTRAWRTELATLIEANRARWIAFCRSAKCPSKVDDLTPEQVRAAVLHFEGAS